MIEVIAYDERNFINEYKHFDEVNLRNIEQVTNYIKKLLLRKANHKIEIKRSKNV